MKRTTAILLGLALATGAGLAHARGGGGGGGHGGGHSAGGVRGGGQAFAGGGMVGRPVASGGFTRFTTGPTRFTTGPHPGHPIAGVRPGPIVGRPGFPPRRVIIGGGAVIVAAPYYWYPPYPYAYPYVAPAYGGSAYEETPQYIEQGSEIRYYCPDYQDYYPNVPSCPSQWMQVIPDTGAYSN